MAALSIQVPYPVFYDRDGQPLDNGNIYIGEANLDPVTNPLQVYYDEALTITASQPIKTSNGYIYRNGTPAQLYVNAVNFSITVNDSKNLLVYNFPDGTGIQANASLIDYDPPFIGAVTTGYTVADKLSQTVSVQDFGATGDGVTNDTAAIQSAFDAISANGGGIVSFPPGTYIIDESVLIGSNTTVIGAGRSSLIKASQTGWIGTNAAKNCFLFRNENYSAGAITDANIVIENMAFDYGAVVVSGGGAHMIAMRYVDSVTVTNCYGQNGENVTAFLACQDTLVQNCEGYNVSNCYFDHWDGAKTAKVIGCVGRNDVGTYIAQGIQFTGTGSVLEDRTSLNCFVAFNYLENVRGATGQSSAIIANANDAGSATYRMMSCQNIVNSADLGLVYEGAGGQHLSLGDTFVQVDQLPIFMQLKDGNTPSHCRVIDAHLIDCDHDPGNIALISISGGYNEIRDLKITNTVSAAYDSIAYITSNGSNTYIDVSNCPSGSGQRVVDSGTNSCVIDAGRAPTSVATGGYSILPGEENVIFTAGCTVTMPNATAYSGRKLTFLAQTSGTVVSASSNIVPLAGGAAGTAILSASAGKWATLISNGTNWQILAAN